VTLALQALPLALLLGLLVSGRATPVPAVLVALAASLPAVLLAVDAPLPFLLEETARGAFLALKPILVVAGGLLFHAAVTRHATAPRAADQAAPRAFVNQSSRAFVVTLLGGAFLECVTGFAVGAVFALASLRGLGLRGAPAGALALLALTLVPWGGLGPGTALGAALTGLPAQDLAAATALPNAAWLLLLGPVFWRLCAAAGVVVTAREKAAQTATLALMAAMLVGLHALLPFEVVGILVTGGPLLFWLWRLDPRVDGAALRRLAPYAVLTAALLAARAIPDPPAWQPFADAPATARAAMSRARRPALAMLLYVVLARWLAGGGIAASLAGALAAALGEAAPYGVPVLGLVSGMVTGSNVGSNAALMPVQAALGAAAGLPPLAAPGLHNFAGSAGAGMSFAVTAMICGLLADGTRPTQLWRLLAPSLAAVLLIGWLSLALG